MFLFFLFIKISFSYLWNIWLYSQQHFYLIFINRFYWKETPLLLFPLHLFKWNYPLRKIYIKKDCFKLEIFYALAMPRKKNQEGQYHWLCFNRLYISAINSILCNILDKKREPYQNYSSLIVFPMRERIQQEVVLELSLTMQNFMK